MEYRSNLIVIRSEQIYSGRKGISKKALIGIHEGFLECHIIVKRMGQVNGVFTPGPKCPN
jgi:hypothetical protein